jgi:hypothetical protein
MKVFDRPFFRKAWWRVNVVVLASASDATLMLDFCEVQHPKLNQRAALGRASQSAKYSMAFHFAERNMFFFAPAVSKRTETDSSHNSPTVSRAANKPRVD